MIFNENILTKPSPPAVQNIFPLFEKSTQETSLLKSCIEQKAYLIKIPLKIKTQNKNENRQIKNNRTFSKLFLSNNLASLALLPPARIKLPSILLNWPL